MNFTFDDISSSYLNMVQQDLPGKTMLNNDNTGSQNQAFADKLNKTLENIEQHAKKAVVQADSTYTTSDADEIVEFLSDKLEGEKGVGFVSALKNIFLMLSKGDLKNVSMDAQGLEALKKMLLKAGFNKGEVNDLILDLSDELEKKGLTMDDVLDSLFGLSMEDESDSEDLQENFLEISSLPFLESILGSLGIDPEKIQEILSNADKGEKGISIDAIIENLQKLQKESFYSGNEYKTREGDESFKQLFKSIDLEMDGSETSALTLNDLVSSLEKLKRKISQQQITAEDNKTNINEKSQDLLSDLFKGLKIKNQAVEINAIGFSYDQVKDQFKNELLIPENGKDSKKGLFSPQKNANPAAAKELNAAFKEMEALLTGKKSLIENDSTKENKEFLKHLKSETAKSSDNGQVLTSDPKTGEAQSNLNVLKAKASFKNLPTYVTQQVTKGVVRAINQGEDILKIQLKPAELGRIILTIDNTGNSMKVSIMTENAAAKDILASNVNEIRTVLSNSGITLERFDVDMNSNFRQSMADTQNQAGNFGKRNKNREKNLLDSVNGEGMNDPISLLDALSQDGSLHFVA